MVDLKTSINACQTISLIKTGLNFDESFDLIYRKILVNGKTSALFFIDGFTKDEVMEKIMEFLYSINDDSGLKDADIFLEKNMPYIEVSYTNDIDDVLTGILSGTLALVIDGLDKVLLLDTRTYPQRQTAEPSKDRVLRGSRDGFVETLVSNTALIRRRIRNPNLSMKMFSVGQASKTDVVLCFLNDRVDKKLLKSISEKISSLKVDSLTMNQQSLIEGLYKRIWINPFPKIKYTERPDTAASSVLDGNIVILVDNSPAVTIIPTSLFDILEEADDYYFPPITGSYLRLSRYLITVLTLILTPLWLLALKNPQYVPQQLLFIISIGEPNVPVIWQLLILEFSIDGLRLASMNTPPALNTPLSIIGGIILSDFAVSSGWFTTQTMIYMAFVAMANYSQPNFELGYALKFMRISLLILVSLFNIIGFCTGLFVIFLMLTFNKTLSEKSYLYPIIPFNGKRLLNTVFRNRPREQ